MAAGRRRQLKETDCEKYVIHSQVDDVQLEGTLEFGEYGVIRVRISRPYVLMNPFLRREYRGVEYTPGPDENPREVAREILEEIYRLCPVYEKGLPRIDGKEIPLAAYLGVPRNSFSYHRRTWRKALSGLLKAGGIDNSLHSRMCADLDRTIQFYNRIHYMSFLKFRDDTFGETRFCWDLNDDFLGGSVYPVRTDQDKVADPWIPGLLKLQSSDGSSFRMDVAGYESVALSDLTMEYNLIEPYLDFRISLVSPGIERDLKITLGTPSDLVRLSNWFNALATGSHTSSRFLFSGNGLELEWGYGKETDERIVTVTLGGTPGVSDPISISFVLDRESLIKSRTSVNEMCRAFPWQPYPIKKIRRINGGRG